MKKYWTGQGGLKEVFLIAIPLILSTGAYTVQMFTDRMFLMWYDREAMSAALFAGCANFSIVAFLVGTVSYVNTFVAQYMGANQKRRVGPAVWQGIYLSIIFGIGLLFVRFLAEPIMHFAGHSPAVQQYEISYFKILCFSGVPVLLIQALSSFYTGRGKTWIVMWVNVAGCVVNIILDYCMIFGKFGFPKLGIEGAAYATVIGGAVSAVLYMLLFFRKTTDKEYATLSGWRFDMKLMKRILRFGLPSGLHFMLDVFTFSVFLMLIGKYGVIAQGATSIVFSINMFAFMPMIGLGIACSVLVGKYLGMNAPEIAQRSGWLSFWVSMVYMSLIVLCYIFFGEQMLYPFKASSDPQQFEQVRKMSMNLIYFVAAYCIFDGANIILGSALKGAGDTRFVMLISVTASWLVMVLPVWLGIRLGWSIYMAWLFLTLFVVVLGIIFLLRFIQGKWKKLRVIEMPPPNYRPNEFSSLDSDMLS